MSKNDRSIADWKSKGLLGEYDFQCESARAAEAQRILEASVDKNAIDIGVGLSNEEIWGEGPWGRRPQHPLKDGRATP